MGKAFIVFLFGISLYVTLDSWYKQGNTGIPDPAVLAPAAWLFGILALSADFLEGLPVILATALTIILWERTKPATVPTRQQSMSLGRKVKP